MSEERWNPTPPGWKPIPKSVPRPRGEELWRLTRNGKTASCELRDDRHVGAEFELIMRHDDEILFGRRCHDEAEARYYANAFRQDYSGSGWTETTA